MNVVGPALGVLALLLITTAVSTWAGVGIRRLAWWSIARAVVQLAIISLLLRGVLENPLLVGLALLVMLGAATWTSWRRLPDLTWSGRAVVLACAAGASVVLVIAFALRMLPADTRYVVALGGIVIGSTMTATTLAGRAFRGHIIARRAEVEGWLAIGATPPRSVLDLGRASVVDAVTPGLDQTRTTGLVTLPGAFVGALMGGASVFDAGKFQIVVLACLLAAQTISAVLLVKMLGLSRTLPTD